MIAQLRRRHAWLAPLVSIMAPAVVLVAVVVRERPGAYIQESAEVPTGGVRVLEAFPKAPFGAVYLNPSGLYLEPVSTLERPELHAYWVPSGSPQKAQGVYLGLLRQTAPTTLPLPPEVRGKGTLRVLALLDGEYVYESPELLLSAPSTQDLLH